MHDLLWDGYEYLQQGGWVMIPLGLTSLVMWALIADRLLNYWQLGRRDIDAGDALTALAAPSPAAETSLSERRGGLRRQLLHTLLQERWGDGELDGHILHQHSLALRAGLRRHLKLIAVLAGVAPLLGLLGTVLGMIETFEVIALFGTGNAKAMAGGISVALVTTQTGLLIAVPGLLVSAALARRARRLEMGFDEFTHLLDRALKNQDQVLAGRA
jgi:biopolymer transport protein ExbB